MPRKRTLATPKSKSPKRPILEGTGFVTNFNFITEQVSGRGYVHSYQYDETYGGELSNAVDHLHHSLEHTDLRHKGDVEPEDLDYTLAILWGEDGMKMIDFFGFGGLRDVKWPGNPTVYTWGTTDGELNPGSKIIEIGCGDVNIMLGHEEKLRRRCKNIAEYLQSVPRIEGRD